MHLSIAVLAVGVVMSCEYAVACHALVHWHGVVSSTYVMPRLTNMWVYTISEYISCILRICGMWAAAVIYMATHLQGEEEATRDEGGGTVSGLCIFSSATFQHGRNTIHIYNLRWT